MAQQVATQEGSGENEICSDSSNQPTMKEFLAREFEQTGDEIHQKIVNIGITNIDTLIHIDDKDLDELRGKLNLGFADKVKFRSAVKKLQETYKRQPQQSIVTISAKEQSMMDQLNLAMKQSLDIQQIFQRHFNSIEDHMAKVNTQIDNQIDSVIQALQQRKTALHKQVEL